VLESVDHTAFFCVDRSASDIFFPFTKHHIHRLFWTPIHSLKISLPTAFFPAQRFIMVSLVKAGSNACSKRSG
jgi:hypothetical protein